MTRSLWHTAVHGCLLTALSAQPQTLADITTLESLPPVLRPFRAPSANIVPPAELFDVLRRMHAFAKNSKATGASRVYFDDEGREVCDSPTWLKDRDLLKLRIENQGGTLNAIIEGSKSGEDRDVAWYGSFYVHNPDDVLGLVARLPGEPLRQLREANYEKALAFIRAQWSKDSGTVGPQGEKLPKHSLNLIPFAALLLCKDPLDQAQGLWFLREALLVRPQYAKDCLQVILPHLRHLLVAEDKTVRREARDLLESLDKKQRKPLGPTFGDKDLLAWLDAVEHDLLPPVRRVSDGLVDIHPSKDRDAIVEKGRELLPGDSLGEPANGKTKAGAFYRGFRITRLPEPLDLLPLPLGAVITSINGTPVSTGQSVLDLLETQLIKAKAGALLVEYVEKGEAKAVQFRIVSG
jgi:hypothetical protein